MTCVTISHVIYCKEIAKKLFEHFLQLFCVCVRAAASQIQRLSSRRAWNPGVHRTADSTRESCQIKQVISHHYCWHYHYRSTTSTRRPVHCSAQSVPGTTVTRPAVCSIIFLMVADPSSALASPPDVNTRSQPTDTTTSNDWMMLAVMSIAGHTDTRT